VTAVAPCAEGYVAQKAANLRTGPASLGSLIGVSSDSSRSSASPRCPLSPSWPASRWKQSSRPWTDRSPGSKLRARRCLCHEQPAHTTQRRDRKRDVAGCPGPALLRSGVRRLARDWTNCAISRVTTCSPNARCPLRRRTGRRRLCSGFAANSTGSRAGRETLAALAPPRAVISGAPGTVGP